MSGRDNDSRDHASSHIDLSRNRVPFAVSDLTSVGTGFPLLSVTGSILYTWSTDAAKMNKALLLRCLPGQILLSWDRVEVSKCIGSGGDVACSAYRLPKPNAIFRGSCTFGLSWPSLRNLSGLNVSGSGYAPGSRSIALLDASVLSQNIYAF